MTARYLTYGAVLQRAGEYVKANGGVKTVAKEMGVSPNYVYMMLNGKKGISPKLQALIGVQAVTIYEIEREDP